MGEQTFITVPNEKQYQSSLTYLILNSLSFLRCLTLVLRKAFNKVFCLLLHTFHFLGFLLQSLLLK